jgi:hypothetical protein
LPQSASTAKPPDETGGDKWEREERRSTGCKRGFCKEWLDQLVKLTSSTPCKKVVCKESAAEKIEGGSEDHFSQVGKSGHEKTPPLTMKRVGGAGTEKRPTPIR